MAENLNFSLPEKKQKSSITNSITIILLLILIGLSAANIATKPAKNNKALNGTSRKEEQEGRERRKEGREEGRKVN